MTDERVFVDNWWRQKFSMPNDPTDQDVIMFAHALELLAAYQTSGGRSISEATTKSWLDGWWRRKFEGSSPKHGNVLNLAGVEDLLIGFRKFIELESLQDKKGTGSRRSVKSRIQAIKNSPSDQKSANDSQTE